MVRAGTTQQRTAPRAQVVLAAGDGKTSLAIAAQTGLSKNAVSKWRSRYASEGAGRAERTAAVGPAAGVRPRRPAGGGGQGHRAATPKGVAVDL